jgi:hypothetical protein
MTMLQWSLQMCAIKLQMRMPNTNHALYVGIRTAAAPSANQRRPQVVHCVSINSNTGSPHQGMCTCMLACMLSGSAQAAMMLVLAEGMPQHAPNMPRCFSSPVQHVYLLHSQLEAASSRQTDTRQTRMCC